jgi:hypothetical protein
VPLPCGSGMARQRSGAPSETHEATSRGRGAVAVAAAGPRGVELTFGALSTRRIGLSGCPIPLRPLAGPWGFPSNRRPRPSLNDLHACLPWPSPLLQGFTRVRPSPGRPCGLRVRRASRGVSCPSAHHGFAGPPAQGSQPLLRSALRVSTLSAACSPRALPGLFHPGALMGFTLQGFDPPGPSVPPSEGPSPPRRWAAAGRATSGARGRAIVARPAASSPRLLVPGVRPPRRWFRASRRAFPSWASSSLGISRPPPSRPRFPGGHPPSSVRTGIGLSPCSRPGSAGSSTATDLARLRESSVPCEVLPLL